MRAATARGGPAERKPAILLAGALISLLGYLALAVVTAEQVLIVVDEGTRAWALALKRELPWLPMDLVSRLGDRRGLIPLIGLAVLVLWRANRRWALAMPCVMAGAGAIQYVAKWAADRPRPDTTPWGFPSGHVLSLVVFCGLIIYLIASARGRRRRWRLVACGLCALTVLVVAFSRLYLDRHWLSDLAGGLTVGLAYLLVMIWMVEIIWDRQRHRGAAAPRR
jgi:undecaprenyl-diphosphatase